MPHSRLNCCLQEAHEAIRPTDISTIPEQLAGQGIRGQALQLYDLIRNRTLACQAAPAKLKQVSAFSGKKADPSVVLLTLEFGPCAGRLATAGPADLIQHQSTFTLPSSPG